MILPYRVFGSFMPHPFTRKTLSFFTSCTASDALFNASCVPVLATVLPGSVVYAVGGAVQRVWPVEEKRLLQTHLDDGADPEDETATGSSLCFSFFVSFLFVLFVLFLFVWSLLSPLCSFRSLACPFFVVSGGGGGGGGGCAGRGDSRLKVEGYR